MAIQEIVRYLDDMTGEVIADESEVHVVPILDDTGARVAVAHMSPESYAQWRAFVAPILGRAETHKVSRKLLTEVIAPRSEGKATTPAPYAPIDSEQSRQIREWAARNGPKLGLSPVSARGRVPADVVAAHQEYGGMDVRDETNTNGHTGAPAAVFVEPSSEAPEKPAKASNGKPAKAAKGGAKKTPAKANGKSKDAGKVTVSKDEFLAVYKQTGGDTAAIMDATGMQKNAVYSRVKAYRDSGDIPRPAKSAK